MIAPGTQGPVADEKEKEKQVPPNIVVDGEEDEEEEEEAVNGAPAAGALLPKHCWRTSLITFDVHRRGKEEEEKEEV